MNDRKEFWSEELEAIRKAVRGDGSIKTTFHCEVRMSERGYNDLDIALVLLTGTIIFGYSGMENRKRKSKVSDTFPGPTREILGRNTKGNWLVVVVSILSSNCFEVVTCFSPQSEKYQRFLENCKKDI